MKRRLLLGVIGVGAVSSGVLGDPHEHGAENSLAERFDCSEASRPACVLENDDVERADDSTETVDGAETEPYPDPPISFDAESIVSFVREHERAYARNDARCSRDRPERIVDYSIEFDDVRRFDWYDEIHVVRVRYAETPGGVDEDGEPWTTADGYGGAVYAVDETAAVRTGLSLGPSDSVPSETETPDPVSTGTLVDCFR
ncbi:hypothetical protein [Natronococcus sp. A-GB7]|uniref:hypothetical protein n=1 Tax=Natronococcus sp. A-GB7 TaxID=3037649 RepID=UPI0024200415|nr:hypothetical protein [Natronococcus sp. A-GB7]MDG5821010.1 hypothetical protein [Natronococcus sp. A-GB7]